MSLRVFLGLCAALTLAGCDTPASRARVYFGTFETLSYPDRRLVLSGRVRPGMTEAVVYIALGEPDAKQRSGDGKDPSETWLYRRQLTLKAPMDSFDRWLPGNSLFAPAGSPTVGASFGFGGVGNEGVTLYQPHLAVPDDTVRRAVFEDGHLTRYEESQAGDAAAR